MKTAQQATQTTTHTARQPRAHTPFFTPFIQPKLTINQPKDQYEQEADAVAVQVLSMKSNVANQNLFFKPAITSIQRKCAHCEEQEKKAQRKEASVIQKEEPASASATLDMPVVPDFALMPPSLLRPASEPDYLSMRQPFITRNVFQLWDPDSAQQVWQFNFNFFRRFGLAPSLSTTLTNLTAPRFIDSQLKASNPTWWEITDRELNTSSLNLSLPLLDFNADFSPTAPSWLKSILGSDKKNVQRKCAHCEEEEKLQRKEETGDNINVQKTEQYLNSLNGLGSPLNKVDRTFFESRIGYDFSDVRIHHDSSAGESAKNINALAYTHKNDIVFGVGQYQPETDNGKKLLAHELTHVVQQSENRVQPKMIQRVGEDKPSLYYLGTNFYKEEKDIPAKDKSVTGIIQSPSPIPTDFVLYNALKPSGTEPLQSLVSASLFYKVMEGKFMHQIWTRQPKEDPKWFFWGWANPKYLSYVEAPLKKPSGKSTDNDIIPEEMKGLMRDSGGTAEAPVTLSNTGNALLKAIIKANMEGNVAMHAWAIKTIAEAFGQEGKTAEYQSILSEINAGDWEDAAEELNALETDEMLLIFTQLNEEQITDIDEAAAIYPNMIDALSDFRFLYEEASAELEQKQSAAVYEQAVKDGDWISAAKVLSKFSDGVITIKLGSLTDIQLRAMRKAANTIDATTITEIVTIIIAQKSRVDLAMENVLGNQWSLNFFLGMYDAGLGDVFGKSWDAMKADFTAVNSLKFSAGFQLGMDAGVLEDLWDNIKGLAELAWLLMKLQVRMTYDAYGLLKDMYDVLKGLGSAALFALDAREVGYHVGRYIGKSITKEFIQQGYFDRGWFLGKMTGKLITEIALLFVGVEEIAVISKAVKGTALFVKIGEALGKSEKLKVLMEALPKLRLAKGVKPAEDAAEISKLAKGASMLEDVPKIEKTLTEMAKYEKEAGELISKEMKGLEEVVMKEKVKNPENIHEVPETMSDRYAAEIETGNHTYRRKFDGTWCRFSEPDCGTEVASEISDAVKTWEAPKIKPKPVVADLVTMSYEELHSLAKHNSWAWEELESRSAKLSEKLKAYRAQQSEKLIPGTKTKVGPKQVTGPSKSSGGTLAVGETDAKLGKIQFEGASPQGGGEPVKGGKKESEFSPDNTDTRGMGHAEERVIIDFDKEAQKAIDAGTMTMEDLKGKTLRMHVEDFPCQTCKSATENAGPLVKFIKKYKGMRLEITDAFSGELLIYTYDSASDSVKITKMGVKGI